jgi:PAS domain-containing protein
MPPEAGEDPGARVCGRCGMGILLEAHPDTAPRADEPFFIVDGRLTICAVSLAAEELLGIEEVSAVTRQLSDFLVPADAEALGPEPLIHSVIIAASDPGPPQTVVVRPAGEFGVRYGVRVGACGPPRAALVVLTDDDV